MLCAFALVFVALIGTVVAGAFKAAVDAPFAHIQKQEARAD
jgi:hypothetical protein